MDNAVAKKEENSVKLQKFGELLGDPFEISHIRREDFNIVKGIILNVYDFQTSTFILLIVTD